ncbi:MAG TPA: cadherin-like domain-containing protein, partial [Xanthobacteraceae bacterium]|nr:cadherin-like domain-containing protein [Xanthobacteraceae bacterium]
MNFHAKPAAHKKNAAPVANDDLLTARGNTPLAFKASRLTANDTDAEGDALKVISVGNGMNGTVSLDWDGNIVFTPDADFSGAASFDYIVSDGRGGTSTATVTVDVAPIQEGSVLRVGSEFLVNTTTRGGQFQPSIAVLANGNFVVTWTDTSRSGDDFEDAVRGQIFDRDGNKIGDEFLVNTTINEAERAPQTTALTNGNFVVTWLDAGGDDGEIRAQMFDANGSKLGSEFVVNATTAGTQDAQSITALANGRFVVTWEDFSSGNGEIKAQIFSDRGLPDGSEFVVNQTAVGDQYTPSITALANGGFVVTWEDDSGVDDDVAAVRA